MSENTIKKFQEAVQEDKKLEEKFRKELERIDSENLADTGTEAVIKAAKTLGFELSETDMAKVKAALQVLDPEELKHAAGGGWCWGNYACYTVYHHGDEGEEEACFLDYSCMGAYKGEDCSGVWKQDD